MLSTFKSRQNVYFDSLFSVLPMTLLIQHELWFKKNKQTKNTLLDCFCFKPKIHVNSPNLPTMYKANFAGTSQ